jgi:hypothetical protein
MPEAVRASDAERDRVALMLRDHCGAGRLTLEEFDARLEQVYAAVTREELARTTLDLPQAAVPARREPGRRFFWPGIAPFDERRHLSAGCASAYEQALREVVPRMGTRGFHLIDDIAPRRLAFERDDGLRVTVMFHPAADGGTDVSAFGEAPRAIRKAFATLTD